MTHSQAASSCGQTTVKERCFLSDCSLTTIQKCKSWHVAIDYSSCDCQEIYLRLQLIGRQMLLQEDSELTGSLGRWPWASCFRAVYGVAPRGGPASRSDVAVFGGQLCVINPSSKTMEELEELFLEMQQCCAHSCLHGELHPKLCSSSAWHSTLKLCNHCHFVSHAVCTI